MSLLSHMSKRLIENLSNGYQQRVGIAQAIIHNPEIVILDEPTVGLDPIQIREIRKLIRDIGQQHSVIISTHILPEVEMVCDRVQIIDNGQLVFHGSIEDLKEQRRGNKLLVGFSKAPALSRLKKLKGLIKLRMLRMVCLDSTLKKNTYLLKKLLIFRLKRAGVFIILIWT